MPETPPETQQDIVHGLARMQTRMPRTLREVYTILANVTPESGLDGVLQRVDFTGATPADIYHVLLGRGPGNAAEAIAPDEYRPRVHFKDVILSDEFRHQILSGFLSAFPELARDVFDEVRL